MFSGTVGNTSAINQRSCAEKEPAPKAVIASQTATAATAPPRSPSRKEVEAMARLSSPRCQRSTFACSMDRCPSAAVIQDSAMISPYVPRPDGLSARAVKTLEIPRTITTAKRTVIVTTALLATVIEPSEAELSWFGMAGPPVVHLINSLRRGGSEGQAVQLVRLLHERGYDVTLACLDGDGPLRYELGDDPPDILEYPLTSLHDLRAARQLRRFVGDLRRREVNIVHTHDVYSNIFGLPAARLAGVPVRIGSRRDTGGVGTLARRRVEGFLFRLAVKVVTNAEAVARQLARQGVPAEKIVTIHNAVDFARVEPRLGRTEALEAFGLPPDRRFVVLVANLSHDVKDHPMFIRAARRIKEAVPASAFVIAGRGPLAPHMEALAASLGIGDDIFMIGPCTHVGDLLALAEVCVLTSRAEGLSNAVLEYMA